MTLFERAKEHLPGGVNSPVRSFKAVGRDPIFISSANGSKIKDVDGKEYIDYVCSWGPMILGHNHPAVAAAVHKAADNGLSFGAPTVAEIEMAELLCSMVPGLEMVRMVNSGTEAVMSALRLARGFTGKQKIIKFEGCYHGHCDSMLVNAGSGALTYSSPDSSGVTQKQAGDTLLAVYNDIGSVEKLFESNKGEIAGLIVEPVAANMGVVEPRDNFLEKLRQVCDKNGALLIFDEVITGFRLAKGGAQQFFNVTADIVTFGKIIGGGMPVGAYGGSKKIMGMVSPLGSVYQAGTLSGNPVAMAAGITQLEILNDDENIYTRINDLAARLETGLNKAAKEFNAPVSINRVGSLVCPFFSTVKVTDFTAAKLSNTALYAKYFCKMLSKGINLAPAQFEAMFVSLAHSESDIENTVNAAFESFKEMKEEGDF